MVISGILNSIQDEGTGADLPSIFVRLRSCHLRCAWCDTVYAFHGGRRCSLDEVLETVRVFARTGASRAPLVENSPAANHCCKRQLPRLPRSCAVAEDGSGDPDCRPEDYRAFAQLVREGPGPKRISKSRSRVITMRKSEIVGRGARPGVPLDCTCSCYQLNDDACGTCDSCRLRLQAFGGALLRDPVPYRARVAQ